jgi:hypothetical protein
MIQFAQTTLAVLYFELISHELFSASSGTEEQGQNVVANSPAPHRGGAFAWVCTTEVVTTGCSRYSIPDCGWIWVGASFRSPQRVAQLFVAQVQALSDAQITLVVYFAQVGQHSSALTYELEQTTPTGLIFFVCTKMIGQLLDAAGKNCDLHFGRAGISIVAMKVGDELGLNFFLQRHDVCFPFYKIMQVSMPTAQPKWRTV